MHVEDVWWMLLLLAYKSLVAWPSFQPLPVPTVSVWTQLTAWIINKPKLYHELLSYFAFCKMSLSQLGLDCYLNCCTVCGRRCSWKLVDHCGFFLIQETLCIIYIFHLHICLLFGYNSKSTSKTIRIIWKHSHHQEILVGREGEIYRNTINHKYKP